MPSIESKSEKLPGSRLSISAIEKQIPIYEKYKETGEIGIEEINKDSQEDLEHLAKISFTGTQLHNLTYFQNLSRRCERLGRIPTYDDLRDTFPTTEIEKSKAIAQLYTELENPIEVWKEWIKNSEIPKDKNAGMILDPETTKGIWDSGIYNPDINKIVKNIEEPNLEQVEMHEVLTVLNLNLKRNLQIPSYVDTLILEPKNSKKKKLTIVDYKTGNKDLSKITFLDKVQALLMSVSVFYSFVDKKINYKFSDWDVTHPIKDIDLPHLEKRAVLEAHKFNKSTTDYELLFHLKKIEDDVKFILKNPLTNKSVEVLYAPIAKTALEYLNDLSEFYAKNKNKLKKSKIDTFTTPQFIPEKVLDYENYITHSQYNGIQRAFV
jgi:hypothetical protein